MPQITNLFIGGSGTHLLSNCIFSNNNGTGSGGAVQLGDVRLVTITFQDVLFINNSAHSFSGAVDVVNANATFISCTVDGNSANQGGALYLQNRASLTIITCLFHVLPLFLNFLMRLATIINNIVTITSDGIFILGNETSNFAVHDTTLSNNSPTKYCCVKDSADFVATTVTDLVCCMF